MLFETRAGYESREHVGHRYGSRAGQQRLLPFQALRVPAVDQKPEDDGPGRQQHGFKAFPAVAVFDQPAANLPEARILCAGHVDKIVEDIFLKHSAHRAHRAYIDHDRHGKQRHSRQIAQRILPQAASGADGIDDIEQYHHAQTGNVADLDQQDRRRRQPQDKGSRLRAARLPGIGMDHHRKAQQHKEEVKFLTVQVLPADPQQHLNADGHAQDVAPWAHQPARHQHQQQAVAQSKEHLQHINARCALHDHLRYRHHQKEQWAFVFRNVHIGGIPVHDAAPHAKENAAVRSGVSIQRMRAAECRKRPQQHDNQADGLGDKIGFGPCRHGSSLLCILRSIRGRPR